jgi:tetratricopeptide (TPR) repeat protein
MLAPQLPNSFREMEPLFSAVICGCNAGLFREALHEVYIPRIQRSNACFAANVLGATGPLLAALVHFFEDGRWGSLVETSIEGQSLTAEDKLFILMQAGLYLATTRSAGAPEARICYERAESLCHLLNDHRLLCIALRSQFRHTLMTDKTSAAMQIAERVYSLAQEQNDAELMLGAYNALSGTLVYLGDFESARQYARHGVQIWRSGGVKSYVEDFHTPAVGCLIFQAVSEWHLGEIASSQVDMDEAISLAKELNDKNALALAFNWAVSLGSAERNPAKVDHLASDLIELSTRHNFVYFLAVGAIYRGWARSVSGNTAEGIPWIEQGIRDYRATGAALAMSHLLTLKAEAFYLADGTPEALEALNEAEALAERFEQRFWCAELHRLRGIFLTFIAADQAQIEACFCSAIRTATEQKSVSLAKRAEATYLEYCRQKASVAGGGGFRLPL